MNAKLNLPPLDSTIVCTEGALKHRELLLDEMMYTSIPAQIERLTEELNKRGIRLESRAILS